LVRPRHLPEEPARCRLCRRFAAEDYHVLVAGRTASKIETSLAALRRQEGSAELPQTDRHAQGCGSTGFGAVRLTLGHWANAQPRASRSTSVSIDWRNFAPCCTPPRHAILAAEPAMHEELVPSSVCLLPLDDDDHTSKMSYRTFLLE
jgi:hypothetical protein